MSFDSRIRASLFPKTCNYVHNDSRYTRSLIASDVIVSFYFFPDGAIDG